MRQPRWLGGFGVLAILLAAGCEDLPTTVAVTASPSPSASPSASPSGSPSPSPSASPSKSPSPTPTPTPTIRPTATPTPRPTEIARTPTPVPTSPTTTPTASPLLTTPATVVMDTPDTSTDFTRTTIPVTLHAEVPSGVAIKELDVLYDDLIIYRQISPQLSFSTAAWNPNVRKGVTADAVSMPVPFGPHKLKGRAVTNAGVESFTQTVEFYKSLLFRDWVTKTSTNGTQVNVPPLPIARSGVKAYASDNSLFAVFGRKPDGTPADSILKLGLGDFPPTWTLHSSPDLTWREGFALAGSQGRIFLVGGKTKDGADPGAPTASVQAFSLFDHATTNLPDLPQAVLGASAVVVDHYLYVMGGSTTGAAADATDKVYRIALTTDDRPDPNQQWQARSALPVPMRGTAAVVGGGRLFLMGGQVADGTRRENIYAYDAAGDSWPRVQLLPGQGSDGAAVELGNAIWYFGGRGSDGNPSKATYRFDYLATNMPARAFPAGVPNLPLERANPAAAVVEDNDGGNVRRRLFVLGGDHLEADQLVPSADVIMGDTL